MPRRTWLYATLVLLALVSAVGWVWWPQEGGNFFAEAMGIIITVALIDRLIRWEEEARLAPAKLASLRDALAVTREAADFVLALARSSVPASEMANIKTAANNGESLSSLLADHLAQIRADSVAPYGAPPPYGSGLLRWEIMLPKFVSDVRVLIDRYLQRHTPYGDPALTEAISDLEENGLFRALDAGTGLFFSMSAETRASMYDHYLKKVERLLDVASRTAEKFPQMVDAKGFAKFNWTWLEAEIASHPTRHEQEAPWRPSE